MEAPFEVSLRPPFHGCLVAFATVFSLGLYPLLRHSIEGRFVRRMDDQGVETRAGRRVAWGDFTRVRRVRASVQGAGLSEEILLESRGGRVSLPLWRIDRAEEALAFLSRRLPADIGR
jgi:hypothetical protein